MIRRLLIENLVLVERAEIEFGPGLNILTGETGAGKSAILTAIRLLLGERADGELIRQGAQRAVVEASIFLGKTECVLRRELSASGKSRIFLDDEQLSLAELRERVAGRLELVDQSSSLSLRDTDEHRKLLDAFARLDVSPINELLGKLAAARSAQREAEELAAKSSAEEARLIEELAAIDDVRWTAGEDEALTREHHLLTNAEALLGKVAQATDALEPMIAALKRLTVLLQSEPLLAAPSSAFKTARLELEEAESALTRIAATLEPNPARLAAIEERIGAIEALKRRFAVQTQSALEALKMELAARLERIENVESELARAKQESATLAAQAQELAARNSAERRKAAPRFVREILEHLHGLNLPDAALELVVTPHDFTDHVEFRFAANRGQPLGPLTDQASGGELSRLLLAIKAANADRGGASALILDEIDSNVGGQTATMLGEKLRAIAHDRQLICVTHFVQVARAASHHFGVSKATKGERATTTVRKLSAKEREVEFARMIGS